MTTTTEAQTRKRRRVRRYQRWVLNPPMKIFAWLGLVRGHVIVQTTGRKTGKRRRTVVGAQRDDGGFWIVAEHGRYAGWVRNVEATPEVRVRHHRRWYDGRGHVVDTDNSESRLDSFGLGSHARLVRKFGTDLTTIRIDVPPAASESGPV